MRFYLESLIRKRTLCFSEFKLASQNKMAERKAPTRDEAQLKGWAEISRFLELPVSSVQRWAKEGLPVRREGRYVVASREELNQWIGSNRSGASTVLTNNKTDLANELKRSVDFAKRKRAA